MQEVVLGGRLAGAFVALAMREIRAAAGHLPPAFAAHPVLERWADLRPLSADLMTDGDSARPWRSFSPDREPVLS